MKSFELVKDDASDRGYIPRVDRPGFESSAAGGRLAEREYIEGLKKDALEGNAEDLRNAVAQLDTQIGHIQASIEVLAERIEAGRRIKGAEDLQRRLSEETNIEKRSLLREKMRLEAEKRQIEEQLRDL